MKKTHCDICDADDATSFFFCTGWETSPAGDKEHDGEFYDLCPRCELMVLRDVFNVHYASPKNGTDNAKMIAAIKELKNPSKDGRV